MKLKKLRKQNSSIRHSSNLAACQNNPLFEKAFQFNINFSHGFATFFLIKMENAVLILNKSRVVLNNLKLK